MTSIGSTTGEVKPGGEKEEAFTSTAPYSGDIERDSIANNNSSSSPFTFSTHNSSSGNTKLEIGSGSSSIFAGPSTIGTAPPHREFPPPQLSSCSSSPPAPRRNSLPRRSSDGGSSDGLVSPGLGSPLTSPGKLRRLKPPNLQAFPAGEQTVQDSSGPSAFSTASVGGQQQHPFYPQQQYSSSQQQFGKPPAHPSDLRSPTRRRSSSVNYKEQEENHQKKTSSPPSPRSSDAAVPISLLVMREPSTDTAFTGGIGGVDDDSSSPPLTSKTHVGRPVGLPEIIPPAQSADDLASTGGYGAGYSETSVEDRVLGGGYYGDTSNNSSNNQSNTDHPVAIAELGTNNSTSSGLPLNIMRGPNSNNGVPPLVPMTGPQQMMIRGRRSSLGTTNNSSNNASPVVGSPKVFLAFGRRGSTDSYGAKDDSSNNDPPNMFSTTVGSGAGDSYGSLPGHGNSSNNAPPSIGVDESASNVGDNNSPQFYGNSLAQLDVDEFDSRTPEEPPLTKTGSSGGGRPLLQSVVGLLHVSTTGTQQQQQQQRSTSVDEAPKTLTHKERRESLSSVASSGLGTSNRTLGVRSNSPQPAIGGGLRAFGVVDTGFASSPVNHSSGSPQHRGTSLGRGGGQVAHQGHPLTLQAASPHSLQFGRGGNVLSPSPANSAISAQVSRQGSLLRTTSGLTTHRTPRDFPSEIIPNFLYLGGQRAALSKQRMEERSITRYLCCAFDAALPRHIEQSRLDSGEVLIKHLKMKDGAKTQLKEYFAEAFGFIRASKKQGQRIYIYCREGKSRSASIVIGYFMKYMELTYTQALAAVRQRRSQVDPNFAFCHQLDQFENHTGEIPGSASETPNSMWLNAHVGGSALSAVSRAHQHHRLSFMSTASSTTTASVGPAVSLAIPPHLMTTRRLSTMSGSDQGVGGGVVTDLHNNTDLVVLGALGLPQQQQQQSSSSASATSGGVIDAISPTSESYSPQQQLSRRGVGGGDTSETRLAPPPFTLPRGLSSYSSPAANVQTVDSGFFEPLSTTTTTNTANNRANNDSSFSPGPGGGGNDGGVDSRQQTSASSPAAPTGEKKSALPSSLPSFDSPSAVPLVLPQVAHRQVQPHQQQHLSIHRAQQHRAGNMDESDWVSAGPAGTAATAHALVVVGGGLSQPATPMASVTPISMTEATRKIDEVGPKSSSVNPPQLPVGGAATVQERQEPSISTIEDGEAGEGPPSSSAGDSIVTSSSNPGGGVMRIMQQFTPTGHLLAIAQQGNTTESGGPHHGYQFLLSSDGDESSTNTTILGSNTQNNNNNSNNHFLSSQEAEELFLFSGSSPGGGTAGENDDDWIDPGSFLSPDAATELIRELSDHMVDESERRTASRQDGAVTPSI